MSKKPIVSQDNFERYLKDMLDKMFVAEDIQEGIFPEKSLAEINGWIDSGILIQKISELKPDIYDLYYSDWKFNIRKR